MSTVENKTYFVNGGVPTAAELNAPYDSLASAKVDTDNTATGWMTYKHLVTPSTAATVFNNVYEYSNATTTQTNYNNTTYAAIAQGGNNCRVTLGFTPAAFEPIRFHGSLLVGTVTATTDYDYVNNNGKPNFYAFEIVVQTTTGGVSSEHMVGEWGYSFTSKTYGALSSGGSPAVNGPEMQWQTVQFSSLYWPNSGNITYDWAEIRVKVYDNTNTVGITRHAIQVIRPKE